MSKNIDFLSLHSTQNQTATNGTNNQFQQNISYINNSEPEEKNNDEMSYTDDKFDMKNNYFLLKKQKIIIQLINKRVFARNKFQGVFNKILLKINFMILKQIMMKISIKLK